MNSEESDAAWFVRTISEHLRQAWSRQHRFMDALEGALCSAQHPFSAKAGNQDLKPYEKPSSAMIAVAMEDGAVSVYRAGNCGAKLYNQETAAVFQPSRLDQLDQKSILLMWGYLREGLSRDDVRARLMPTLRAHRSMMTSPGGYPSLSIGTGCPPFIEKTHVAVDPGTRALLCSDGFSAAYERYDVCHAHDILSGELWTLNHTIEQVRQAEHADQELSWFPRLKPSDDATAVLLEFVG